MLSRIAVELRRGADRDALHGRARWYLLWGDESRNLERAAALLRSLAAGAENPDASADLGAAMLLIADRTGLPEFAIDALNAIEDALRVQATHAEALFNRALTLEYLGLYQASARAWRKVVEEDEDGDWRTEAARRLEIVESRSSIDRERPPVSALENVFVLLRRWSASGNGSPPELRILAGDLSRLQPPGDDALASELASELGQANVGSGAMATGGADAGLMELGQALVSYEHGDYEKARRRLLAVGRIEPPAAVTGTLIQYLLGLCDYHLSDYGSAAERLAAVRDVSSRRGHSSLLAAAARMSALVSLITGDLGAAARLGSEALRAAEGTGDPDAIVRVSTSLAWVSAEIGADRAAWSHRHRALRLLPGVRWPRIAYAALEEAVESFRDLASHSLALAAADALVDVATEMDDPRARAGALLARARALTDAEVPERARDDLRAAEVLLSSLPSTDRRRLEGHVLFLQSLLLLAEDVTRAARRSEEALASFRRTSDLRMIPAALAARARSLTAAGDPGARKAMKEAVARLDEARATLHSRADRAAFARRTRAAREAYVRMLLEEGRPVDALVVADGAREPHATLEGALQPWRPAVAGLTPVVKATAAGEVAVLSYFALEDRLLVWLVADGRVRFREVPVSMAQLSARVNRVLRAAHGSVEALRAAGEGLHEILVGDLGGELRAGTDLRVSPDGPLHRLPFGVVWDPRARRFWLEKHYLVKVASLRDVADPTQPAQGADDPRGGPVLLAGAGSESESPGLPRLPGVARELERLALLYDERAMVEPDITRRRFLAAAPGAEIIHFAGHAVTDPGRAVDAHLVLAGADDGGRLWHDEIAALPLQRTRLVILAACSTGDSGDFPSNSLADAFRSAGVPAVIATRWNVEDTGTASFVERLHRRLAAGVPPERALTEVQRASLSGSRERLHPRTWAAFEFHGGHSERSIDSPTSSH